MQHSTKSPFMKSNQLPFFPVSGLNDGEVHIFIPAPVDPIEAANFLRTITNVYDVTYIGHRKFFAMGTQIYLDINYLLIIPRPAFYGISEEKLLLQVLADMWLFFDRNE